ncbi:hypothetical protein JQC92_12890 [Shewanella sp. 202IG2-18]|uniref:hypothetical protein n=1 Tax=Parashewanella hymeniacidonis TaxID=2807618 RepID=UPI0019608E46|nr:hypothetical protein [Parashewanella hymeniacidonis]MBM7072917.1 hypothetical protein [Parashewanella hymeniacidonis]
MPVREIETQFLGNKINGYNIYFATGRKGNVYTNISHWLVEKKIAKISPVDISNTLLVANNNNRGWIAFSEKVPSGELVTIFEVF